MINVVRLTILLAGLLLISTSAEGSCMKCNYLCAMGGGVFKYTCNPDEQGAYYNCTGVDGIICNGCQNNPDENGRVCTNGGNQDGPWYPVFQMVENKRFSDREWKLAITIVTIMRAQQRAL